MKGVNHISSTSTIIPPLPQLVLIVGTAFSIAEILNFCGVFQDESGRKATRKTHEYFESKFHQNNYNNNDDDGLILLLEEIPTIFENWFQREFNEKGGLFHFPTIKNRIESILDSTSQFISNNIDNDKRKGGEFSFSCTTNTISSGIKQLAHKHQFALGNIIGILVNSNGQTPMILCKIVGLTYVLSEILHSFVSSYIHNTYGDHYRYYDKEPLQEFLDETNTHILNSDALFDKLEELEVKFVQLTKLCDEKLSWIRRKIRVFIQSPLQSLEKILDSYGTIVAGLMLGVIIGTMNVFGE